MRDRLREALVALGRRGDVYVDLYVQSGAGHSMSYDDGKIEQTSSFVSQGTSVRSLQGSHSIISHAPGIGANVAWGCYADIAAAHGVSARREPSSTFLVEPAEPFDPPSWEFVHRVDREIRSMSSAISQVTFRFRTTRQRIFLANGLGSVAEDYRQYCTFSAQVVASKGDVLQTGYEVRAEQRSLEEFLRTFDPLSVARTAALRALLMLDAMACPAGPMPVVLSGEAGGTMVHEAVGHGLEADIVQKDYSVYRGRIGERVASCGVTLVDDATLGGGAYGSFSVDDEGTPAARTVLIEDGVLKGYLTDVESALAGDLPLSGNGRRESYRHLPQPRMSNTYILPGKTSPEDIVAQAERGLFVKKLGGGEVNPTSGDFVFHVTEGYLIEKGRVGKPVRGAVLTGNGPQVLQDILAVGNDLFFLPGTCGKGGQGVPVTDGQPTLLLREITVGGSDVDHGSN